MLPRMLHRKPGGGQISKKQLLDRFEIQSKAMDLLDHREQGLRREGFCGSDEGTVGGK